MITLRATATSTSLQAPLERSVWLLADPATPRRKPNAQACLIDNPDLIPAGYPLYLTKPGSQLAPAGRLNQIELPPQLAYLSAGDVLSIDADGQRLRVLWRHQSRQNSVLLTERCDHYCLMCSQPPKKRADDRLLEEAFELVRLLPPTTTDIGFTGGEPTLYGDQLIELLRLCRNLLPQAAVHVLSNGRRFSRPEFTAAWAAIRNPNTMVGIPIYGSEPSLHDYVVQANGAFDETIRGILNLAAHKQPVEIRVVIHKQTAPQLVEIADFISRNLPFVDQVALMGLEMIGFARANMNDVWVDPIDYRDTLREAVAILARAKVHTMVYNHQLCLIDKRVWPYAVKSISDWKNEYHPECLNCEVRERCGGFFFSAKDRVSDHIKAITTTEAPPVPLLQLTGHDT